MITTDGLVHPYPDGDSTIRRMALEARELGFDSIVTTHASLCEMEGVRVIPGVVISAPAVRGVISIINQAKGENRLVLVDAGENVFNRSVISLKGVHILRNLHKTSRHSFDHVTARIAAEKGVAIDLNLRPLIHLRGSIRQKVLQCYQDIVKLQKHYEFPVTISSNARSVLDQRSTRDMLLICALFGMEDAGVDEALSTIGRFLSPELPVRVIG
jgi:ribonuclease P/MRP protein subunit RPP1